MVEYNIICHGMFAYVRGLCIYIATSYVYKVQSQTQSYDNNNNILWNGVMIFCVVCASDHKKINMHTCMVMALFQVFFAMLCYFTSDSQTISLLQYMNCQPCMNSV